MIEWFINKLADLIIGVIVFVVGFYLSLKYLVPTMAKSTAKSSVDELLKHPKIQPTLHKLRELEPLIEKAKKLDLQELVELAKGIKVMVELQTNKPPPPPPKKERR